MTPYEFLAAAERSGCHTIEVIERSTGKTGVANSCDGDVEVFYGSDDGSEDATITSDEFNSRFEITATI